MRSTLSATASPEAATSQRLIAQVVVDARVGSSSGLFDYLIPAELGAEVQPGQRVRVPFGKRSVTGFVYAVQRASEVAEPRQIEALIDAEPMLPPHVIRLAGFIATHYVTPLDEVIRAIVPPRVRAVLRRPPRGPRRRSRILSRTQTAAGIAPPRLEPAQAAAAERIAIALGRHESQVFLLHGVTGSGKTEVYLHLLQKVLQEGGQGLALIPEIALTPQTVARFAARFPGRLAVLDSSLTEAERAAEWWRVRRGEADIAIGPRAAVFAPLPRLRLIVIDEEEASAFKQERIPRYHAPTVARRLAEDTKSVLVLGSATPSVVEYHRALSGQDRLLELPHRVQGRPLPPVTIVDLRKEMQEGRFSPLSQPLQAAIDRAMRERNRPFFS
jgi:primosomal protein N' (replication factor Y)